jgi:hypothetical protein
LNKKQAIPRKHSTLSLIVYRPMPVKKWLPKKDVIISILALLQDHPAVISVKAQRLSFLRERIYIDSEIITDARPVYNTRGDTIVEMIVPHTLVITPHDSTHNNHDLHFTMDANDLVKLRKACDRAMLKAKTLKDS